VTLTFDLVTSKSIGVILVMTNQYVKYEDFVINSNQDNELKVTILTFKAPVTLAFDLVTPKSIGVIY
jgi:hypothetical protein